MTTLSLDDFRAELVRGNRPTGAVRRLAVAEAFPIDDQERTITLCFSDNSIDRMGDSIAVDGWELAAYRRNPVVLYAHDASSPPIGRASNLRVQGNRLLGDVEFASKEIYPFADQIYRLVRARFLNAGSVGFQPIQYEFSRDKDRPYGIDFLRQSLLEFSIVAVPANAAALVDGRGIKSSSERAGRAATIEQLGRTVAQADTGELMPPGFCGVWHDFRKEQQRREVQCRAKRMLRLLLKVRPESERERVVFCERLAELRVLAGV
jgi:HK97 family phage prohead protease